MCQLYLNCGILFGCENNAWNSISKDEKMRSCLEIVA